MDDRLDARPHAGVARGVGGERMKVRTVVRFHDKKEGVTREIGDEFVVSKARFAEIVKVGPFVEEVKAEKPAEK